MNMWMRISLLALAAIQYATGAPTNDEITDLPGLGYELSFRHYSGYLNGGQGKHLHYWFTESSNNPSTDPVMLWLNGGPGCSSLLGLFTELGPYRINEDGKTLSENFYSWNRVANILYLESPACVGFSYDIHGNCTTDDEHTAQANYKALRYFFTHKFPEYRNNELFLAGESYAGIYIPTLTIKVLEGMEDFPLNLQGYAIGNGITSWKFNDNSNIFFGYFHGLYGDILWSNLVQHCCEGGIASKETCNFHDNKDEACLLAVTEAFSIIYGGHLNTYNLYGECVNPSKSFLTRYMADLNGLKKSQYFDVNSMNKVGITPPCVGFDYVIDYMNSPKFLRAAHIHHDLPAWDVCSDYVDYHPNYDSMEEQYKYLTPRTRGLIFSGDIDMACNFLGSEWFIENLDLEVTEKRRMWFYNDNVAGGFVKQFQNLDLVTVLGAGHMVPEDKPAAALKLITSFMKRQPY